MKFQSIKNSLLIALSAILIVSMTSCVKDQIGAPTVSPNTDPVGLYATMTTSQFKTTYYLPNQNNPFPFQIKDSVILSGIVNGDDRSGNIYKTIIFQDSTGGLQVSANVSDLYNTYPVGTRIFVKCKGLYLYNYLGTLELGSYIDTTGAQPALGGIPAVNLPKYVIKGMTGLTVTPVHYSLFYLINGANQLNAQNTLIQVDSVEFTAASDTLPYADAVNKVSGNLILSDCASPIPNTVTVRSSGYADFATSTPPHGHGSVIGIFTIYQNSNGSTVNQMTIRDTTDVMLTGPRACP